jgi:hypothetical protein
MMSVHHDDNHELVQLFDEIVSVKKPWQFATLSYYLPKIGAPTPIVISIGFQNQPSTTNVNLVPTNLKVQNDSNYSTGWSSYVTHPQSLAGLKCESQTKNSGRIRSRSKFPGSQHYRGVEGRAGAPRGD